MTCSVASKTNSLHTHLDCISQEWACYYSVSKLPNCVDSSTVFLEGKENDSQSPLGGGLERMDQDGNVIITRLQNKMVKNAEEEDLGNHEKGLPHLKVHSWKKQLLWCFLRMPVPLASLTVFFKTHHHGWYNQRGKTSYDTKNKQCVSPN